jgi:hypothetical protein
MDFQIDFISIFLIIQYVLLQVLFIYTKFDFKGGIIQNNLISFFEDINVPVMQPLNSTGADN